MKSVKVNVSYTETLVIANDSREKQLYDHDNNRL